MLLFKDETEEKPKPILVEKEKETEADGGSKAQEGKKGKKKPDKKGKASKKGAAEDEDDLDAILASLDQPTELAAGKKAKKKKTEQTVGFW